MAEVNTDSGGGGGKHDKKRAKKSSTRIDMTPMVDLAFLLLTFFVLTSTFNKPKTMEINYPAKPKDDTERIKVNNALTFILSEDNKVFYYYGQFYVEGNKDAKPPTTLLETNFSSDGLRKLLLDYNKPTIQAIKELKRRYKSGEIADTTLQRLVVKEQGKREALTVLVKADDEAEYRNIIDLIDELNICNIGKYAVVDIMSQELALVEAENNK